MPCVYNNRVKFSIGHMEKIRNNRFITCMQHEHQQCISAQKPILSRNIFFVDPRKSATKSDSNRLLIGEAVLRERYTAFVSLARSSTSFILSGEAVLIERYRFSVLVEILFSPRDDPDLTPNRSSIPGYQWVSSEDD
jgi:hypothetical protein